MIIRLVWLLVFAVALGVLVAIGVRFASAHEGFSGWCCNNKDCKVADVQWLPDGRIKATHRDTGLTAIFAKDAKLRPLPPGVTERTEWYACLLPWGRHHVQPRCLYHPDLGM